VIGKVSVNRLCLLVSRSELCSSLPGGKLGIPSESIQDNCVAPITEALRGAIEADLGRVSLTIAPNLRSSSAVETVDDSVPLPAADDNLNSNTEPASDTVIDIQSGTAQTIPLLKLPLEINGVTYVFEYIASADPQERQIVGTTLAQQFCNTHGEMLVRELGVLDSLQQEADETPELFTERRRQQLVELLSTQCLEPITGALVANMEYPVATL
jgi:hypothetical protein